MPVVNIIEDLSLLVASTRADPLDVEILVVNTVEDLLLLVVSTCADSLDIKTLVINIIKDLLLAVSTYKDPLVLKQITYT